MSDSMLQREMWKDTTTAVWLEDARSIEEKMKIVAEYDLAGVAAWSLGGEYPQVWEVITRYNK